VCEVEGDDAVVDEAGEAEDVEVGADQHHVAVAQHPLFGVAAGGAHRRARLAGDCSLGARRTISPSHLGKWAGSGLQGPVFFCKLVLNTRVICFSCWFSFTGTDRCVAVVCLKKPALAICKWL
jgi:hypothetical protein